MKKISRVIITIIAMLAVLSVAAVIYKYKGYQDAVKFESERVARVDEVSVTTDNLKSQIEELSQMSVEQIAEFINENAYVDTPLPGDNKIEVINDISYETADDSGEHYDPWAEVVSGTVSGNDLTDNASEVDDTIDMDDLMALGKDLDLYEGDSETDAETKEETDEEIDEAALEEAGDDWKAGDSKKNVSRVADLGYDAVKNMSSDDLKTVSEAAKDNHNLGDSVGGEDLTLQERQELRTSYEETELWIEADREVVEDTKIDFSDKKITCLGDSVTEAANLIEEPDYQQYTYPTRLKEILGCAEMTNLGIGGSSYGRYWADAFCDRYDAIPKDSDIIIIFGGYNDGYCLHEDMIGSMDNLDSQTLYGAVDDLMKGLKKDYPNAEIVFMTPLPNLLHDVLRKERPELLSQTVIVDCVKSLAKKYDIDVIDAYNANFLDSHDADIVADYIPDSVHPNEKGYKVLAEHVAAELIRILEAKEDADKESASPSPSAKKNIIDKIFNKEESPSPEHTKRPLPSLKPSESPSSKETPSPMKESDESEDDQISSDETTDEESEDGNSEENDAVPKWTPGNKTVVIKRDE